MNIIVAGCGRLGSQLAQLLESEGNKVTVIDRNIDSFKRLNFRFKGTLIEGVAFDKSTLIKAGIENADAVAATTNGDNTNIVTALIAKEKFKVPIIIARIYDPQRAEIYRKMGISTVATTLWGANKIRDYILHPNLYRLNSFGNGEVELVESEVTVILDSRRVGDVAIPEELSFVSIVREGRAIIPTQGTVLLKGDRLLLAVTDFGKAKMKQMLID